MVTVYTAPHCTVTALRPILIHSLALGMITGRLGLYLIGIACRPRPRSAVVCSTIDLGL